MPVRSIFVPMRKTILLLGAALILCAAAIPVSAADITISKDRLTYFVGTYDRGQNTFTEFSVEGWGTNPIDYTNAIEKLPKKEGVYFGFAPWYTNMAQAVLEVPDAGIVYASMVDLKSVHGVKAIMTKWAIEGDKLKLMCVSGNFPGLDSAPTLDGSFVFPDSTRFIVARGGGGDMTTVWRKYIFALDRGDCNWEVFYSLDSRRLMTKPEFTEAWCVMQAPVDTSYMMKVFTRKYKAFDPPASDGSYTHEPISYDSTTISLWDTAKQKKK